MNTIDVMIPVWRPDQRLRWSVERLLDQTQSIRKITLICSEESGWNGKEVKEWAGDLPGVQVEMIKKKDYNHGGTRHSWTSRSDADLFLFLVQDAVPADRYLVERMAKCLQDPRNAVVYARHVPAFGCDKIERYTRCFNYPSRSVRKTPDGRSGGIKDCFSSNVCAMYRRDWYERIGGFERQILLSEDSVFGAKALAMGAAVVYCSQAKVLHAHRYGYGTLWKRYFDIGAVHRMYRNLFAEYSSEKEGIRLVKETAGYLWREKAIALFPRLFLQSGVKFLAYQFGKHYDRLPEKFVECWSWDKEYWRRKKYE